MTKEELTLKLSFCLDRLNEQFPQRKKPASVKANIDHAKKLIANKGTTSEELQDELDLIKKLSDQKKKNDAEESEKLRKAQSEKLELQQKEQDEALHKSDLNSNHLAKLASYAPNPRRKGTGTGNPFRPDWTFYDANKQVWKVDENKLADEIAEDQNIRRIEEKGKIIDYSQYNSKKGQWEIIAPEDLGNLIDYYFKFPANNQDTDGKMYAEDLHTAKAVRDVLLLLKSKILKIDSRKFDQPPKYLVHCKSYDFDVLNWKKIPFSPEHCFVSGLAFNPDDDNLTFLKLFIGKNGLKSPDRMEDLIKTIAPTTQAWLYQSLGNDKTAVKAMIERLGLSMMHNYDDQFIAFIQSAGAGIGKSKFFSFLGSIFQEDSVTALDLDQMAEKGSFDAGELRYHDINLTSEVKTRFISDVALNVLKGLTGGDARNFSQKFKSTTQFKNTDHLWFNMNYLPRLQTYDDATARRFDIFRWHRIANFDEKFSFSKIEQERPELITLALFYAHLLLKHPKKYAKYCHTETRLTRSDNMIKAYLEWAQTNDLFSRFIDEKCILGSQYCIGVGRLVKEINNYFFSIGEDSVKYHTNDLTNKLARLGIFESPKKGNWKDQYDHWHNNVFIYQGITLADAGGLQDDENNFKKEQAEAGRNRYKSMMQRAKQNRGF